MYIQLISKVKHKNRTLEVRGSIPLSSTELLGIDGAQFAPDPIRERFGNAWTSKLGPLPRPNLAHVVDVVAVRDGAVSLLPSPAAGLFPSPPGEATP